MKKVLVSITLGAFATVAAAANYELLVSRTAKNFYLVVGEDLIIQTSLCLELAFSEEATLRTSNGYGQLIFRQGGQKCDVKSVLGRVDQKPGKYAVTANREEDNWFSINSDSAYIQTAHCYEYKYFESAFLSLRTPQSGRLVFESGGSCQVDGIFGRMKLSDLSLPAVGSTLDAGRPPTVGNPLDRFGKRRESSSAAKSSRGLFDDTQAIPSISDEDGRVERAHPGWRNTVRTPEFVAWHVSAPREVKALTGSTRADDVILLLNLYRRDSSSPQRTRP